MQPTIIQAAITGSITRRDQNPALPVTVQENVDAALECWRAGAAIIALHAREDDGTPTQDPDRYQAIVDGIREAGCDAILNVSTGAAAGRSAGADRYACLRVGAEMATFDAGTLNMGERVFENSPAFLRDLAKACLEFEVKPEIECFEVGHIVTSLRLMEEGLLKPPLHFQFVLGVSGGSPASVRQVMHMQSLLPNDATWSVCGMGRYQLPMNLLCFIEGGHVRTGLEDNVYYHRGQLAKSNAQLVERLVRIADELGIPVATPNQARTILGLPTRDGETLGSR